MRLFEEVGVNKDVVRLSDYIVDKIIKSGKEIREYIFLRDEIEDIPVFLPINKLTVKYDPQENGKLLKIGEREGIRGFFDVNGSKRFKSGNVEIKVVLTDLKKGLVYHELNHAFQFIKLGKHQSAVNYSLNAGADVLSKKFQSKEIGLFAHLLYYCVDTELNSKVVEFYARIKGLLKVRLKKTILPKDFDRKLAIERLDRFKKGFFKESLKVEESYTTAKFCEKYDIFKSFEKCDDDEKKLYFALLENFIELKRVGRINIENVARFGFLSQFLGNNIPGDFPQPTIGEDELRKIMREYQIYINSQGKKLRSKLIKTWFLIDKGITVDMMEVEK